ncbi:MAG: hypothetical protein EAX96_14655 [Candidatus Lokiarchaeota archaeon]|nr:hypothetical protein [Candidatus Lokiarchaeota archaeon]
MRIEDREQGVQMECIFCTKLYPELRKKGCPACKGVGFIFQPAQMMDVDSFEREIFSHLHEFLHHYYKDKLDFDFIEKGFEEKKKLAKNAKNDAINLLKKLHIYGFDLSEALIRLIHKIDMIYELENI